MMSEIRCQCLDVHGYHVLNKTLRLAGDGIDHAAESKCHLDLQDHGLCCHSHMLRLHERGFPDNPLGYDVAGTGLLESVTENGGD